MLDATTTWLRAFAAPRRELAKLLSLSGNRTIMVYALDAFAYINNSQANIAQ